MVARALEYIRAGDIFQMVPAQRFETEFSGDALDLYRTLRFINPSPYMFYLNFGEVERPVILQPTSKDRDGDGYANIEEYINSPVQVAR